MTKEISIEIKNLPEIKAAFKQSPAVMVKNLDTAIRKTIFKIESRAVKNAPVKTGRLRASVYTTFAPMQGEIGFNANYAEFVHDGTEPHLIFPKSRQALFWKGASHPVKSVMHPGTRANPFLRKAVDDSSNDVDDYFAQAVQDALDTIAEEANK
jgi:HK97 gp10 family phage protein